MYCKFFFRNHPVHKSWFFNCTWQWPDKHNPLFHFNFDIFFSYQKSSVLFNQDKLSVIHLYPSESSFLDETDSTGQFSKTEDAINNERLRMKTVDTDAPAVASQVETIENVNFVTEGGDFNSFSNDEEGASALLFWCVLWVATKHLADEVALTGLGGMVCDFGGTGGWQQ